MILSTLTLVTALQLTSADPLLTRTTDRFYQAVQPSSVVLWIKTPQLAQQVTEQTADAQQWQATYHLAVRWQNLAPEQADPYFWQAVARWLLVDSTTFLAQETELDKTTRLKSLLIKAMHLDQRALPLAEQAIQLAKALHSVMPAERVAELLTLLAEGTDPKYELDYLAASYWQLAGQLELALDLLERAQLYSNDPKIQSLKKSIEQALATAKPDSSSESALFLDVQALYAAGDVQAAVTLLSAKLNNADELDDSERASALGWLAQMALQLRDYDVAESSLTQLLALNPDDDYLYLSLADIALMKGDTAAAREYLQMRIPLVPDSDYNDVYLARIQMKEGRMDLAQATLNALRAKFPDNQEYFNYLESSLLFEEKQYQHSYALLSEFLAKNPDFQDGYYLQALNAERLGQLNVAEQIFQQLLTKNPEDASALNGLGYTLVDRTGRISEAAAYIEKAYQLEPENPAIVDSMGWLRYKQGDVNGALHYLQIAYQNDRHSEIAAHYAEVLAQAGQGNQAYAVWQAAYQKDPTDAALIQVKKDFGW